MSGKPALWEAKLNLRDIPARYWIWFSVTVVFTIIDQWTKIWVVGKHEAGELPITVIDGFFELVHTQNPGAAFGMFANSGQTTERMIFFGVFTVIAVGVMFHMLWQLPKGDRFQTTAIGLITSGAIGNFIDRVDKQSVTDFLRVFSQNDTAISLFGKWFGLRSRQGGPVVEVAWPSFNVADAAICIGLGMFFFHYLFLEKDEEAVDDMSPETPLEGEGTAAEEISPEEASENNSGVA